MKVSSVLYKGDYSVQVSFEHGTEGIINLSDLVEKGIFSSLKEKEKFSTVYTTGYSIAWSEELEIDNNSAYLFFRFVILRKVKNLTQIFYFSQNDKFICFNFPKFNLLQFVSLSFFRNFYMLIVIF